MIFETQNNQYQGFFEISVTSSIEMLSDYFVIKANNRWIEGGLKAGYECRILDDDGDPILDGYIDTVVPSVGGMVTITGRDKAGDLIDSMPGGTGEIVGQTMKSILQTICEPFGIAVTGDSGETIGRFRYSLTDYVSDIIKTLAIRQGYLVNSDGTGDLVIETAGNTMASFVLREGVNILDESHAVINASKQHSAYTILGQNYDNNTVKATFIGLSGRHRPITRNDTGNIQISDAQTGSEWLGKYTDGSAQQYKIIVKDIQSVRPNRLISCKSDSLGVFGDLFIKSVTWTTKGNGSRTTLDLTNPYAFGLSSVSNTYL